MDSQKIFQISLDDKPYKVKKFKLNETLSNVRQALNISEYYECVDGNGFSVGIDDEENFTLENLIQDNKKGTFSLHYKKCTKTVIVLINNKEEIQIECLLKDTLIKIREQLNKDIKEKFEFILNDYPIKETDESEFIVEDIINSNKILIKLTETKNDPPSSINSINKNNKKSSNDLSNSKSETYYCIICDNKNIGKHKFSSLTTLEEIRKKLDSLIPENSFFLNGKERIDKNSEKYINVNKITDETNILFLQTDIQKEDNNNSNNIIIEEKKDLPQKEIAKEKKRYKIFINGKLYYRRYYHEEKLDMIREELCDLIYIN